MRSFMLYLFLCCVTVAVWAKPVSIPLENFETQSPTVLAGEHYSPDSLFRLTTDHPFEGKSCGILHYHFDTLATPAPQYVALNFSNTIPGQLHRLVFAIRGNGAGEAIVIRLMDSTGETHQYTVGKVTFTGWQELTFDPNSAKPFCYGGDGNKKLDYPISLRSLIIQTPAPAAGDITIDAIRADADDVVVVPPITGNIQLQQSNGYFWGGKEAKTTGVVTMTTVAVSPVKFPAVIRLLNEKEEPICELWKGTATLQAATPFQQNISLALPRYGIYFIDAQVDGKSCARTSACWLPEAAPIWPESPFGICEHFANWSIDKIPEKFDLLKRMGAAWTRDDLLWWRVEKPDGQFIYPPANDQYLQEIKGTGITPYFILGGLHPSFRKGLPPTTPDDLAAYGRFCQDAVGRYKNDVHTWEIWNEPNIKFGWNITPDAEKYAALLKAGSQAVKSADPNAKVSGCVTANIDFDYIERVLKAGGGQYMDVLSIHPYRYPTMPEMSGHVNEMRALQDLLNKYNTTSLKVWISEVGYPTHIGDTGVSEALAAAYLVRFSLLSLQFPCVERIFYYDFQDDGDTPTYNEHHFGMIHRDYSAKVSYAAYNTMVRMLANKTFVRNYPTNSREIYCSEFAGKAGTVIAVWRLRGNGTFAFRGTSHGQVTITDLMGNTMPLTMVNGVYHMAIGDAPVFIANVTDVSPVSPQVSFAGNIIGWAGYGTPVQIVTNEPSLQNISWTLRAPGGWDVHQLKPDRFLVTPPPQAPVGSYHLMAQSAGCTIASSIILTDPITRVVQDEQADSFQIVLTNPYQTACDLAVQVKQSEKDPVTLPVHLMPGVEQRLTVPFSVLHADGWSYQPLEITVTAPKTGAEATVVGSRHMIRGITPCYRINGIQVDGNPVEWSQRKPCALSDESQYVELSASPRSNADDLSAKFWTGTDDDAFYLAMQVKDDIVHQDNKAVDVRKGDSVQFAFAVGDTLFEFGIALTEENQPLIYQWSPTSRIPVGGQIAARREGTTTSYEVRIPWDVIGISPLRQAQAKFSLVVNDDDGLGRKGFLQWFSGLGQAKDTALFSDLVWISK
ncbi:MAG TPA: sugar-binding protein [Armatimonadota bacterium]|nr:sugar-binding protein [Armatimonadota bacterium]